MKACSSRKQTSSISVIHFGISQVYSSFAKMQAPRTCMALWLAGVCLWAWLQHLDFCCFWAPFSSLILPTPWSTGESSWFSNPLHCCLPSWWPRCTDTAPQADSSDLSDALTGASCEQSHARSHLICVDWSQGSDASALVAGASACRPGRCWRGCVA